MATFLLVVDLQLPSDIRCWKRRHRDADNGLMLVLSARARAAAQRLASTLPMTVGPLVVGAGSRGSGLRHAAATSASSVPGVGLVALGLAVTVAPLTAVVLVAVDEARLGIGSGVNKAVGELAGLLGVAVLPVVGGGIQRLAQPRGSQGSVL